MLNRIWSRFMKEEIADNKDRLLQIEIAIIQIESFIAEISEDDYLKSSLISSAVLFQFSVIGEAVGHFVKLNLEACKNNSATQAPD